MGSDISKERKGPVDDSGMTAFDRELLWDVFLGNYRNASTDTLRLERVARALLGATVATLVLFVAWLNHIGIGQ